MRTLTAMVSIGANRPCTRYAFPRLNAWARRHGFESRLITKPLRNTPVPHYEKLAIPAAFPGYDRYIICDDDLLISRNAPEPPPLPSGHVGLAPDAVQRLTIDPLVNWTGNTGLLMLDHAAIDLCEAALICGPTPDIWGIADQGALNHVGWRAGRIHPLDPRWNFMPVISYIEHHVPWEKWTSSRAARLGYYIRLLTGLPPVHLSQVRNSWGLHLVRAPGKQALFDFLLP